MRKRGGAEKELSSGNLWLLGLGLRKKGGHGFHWEKVQPTLPLLSQRQPLPSPLLPALLPTLLPTLLPRALMSQAKVRLGVRTSSLSTVEHDGGVCGPFTPGQAAGGGRSDRAGEVRENAIA